MTNTSNLAFPFQFILTRASVVPPQGFTARRLGEYTLHHDPALAVEVNEAGVLLGHALDWEYPHKSNADILAELSDGDLARTNRLSGRWALILLDGVVVGDGGGTFSIVWNDVHVGSTAALLAYCDHSLKHKDRPDFDQYRSSGWHSGLAFLATDTEIEGVRALLPNHRLSLIKRSVTRFYPSNSLERATVSQNAPRIALMMNGIMEAASLRAPLAIALTAGYDSRLIASAAPMADDKVEFFTIQDCHATPAGHSDIVGAAEIARIIGKPHHVYIAPKMPSTTYEGMIAERFEGWAAVSAHFPGSICISGWGEVGRHKFNWPGSEDLQVRDVLSCNSLHDFPEFSLEAQAWLDEARAIQHKMSFGLPDLMYWEMRLGRWSSAGFNILSQNNWWMTPYTSRDLFELMLSIPPMERGDRGSILYPAAISQLSSSLAALAYSPLSLRERLNYFWQRDLRHAIGRILQSVGLLPLVKKIKRRIRES